MEKYNKNEKIIYVLCLLLSLISLIVAFLGLYGGVPDSRVPEYYKTKNETRRELNHIDTPEEMPEVSYNTYYLLTWHSTNKSFIAPSSSGVQYILNDAWNFYTLPDDTLFISTYDNDILTKQQFMETYDERDIRINRSSDRTLLVPYMGTYIEETATEENYNILISMNEFQYNTNYRYLDIVNKVGTYDIKTYWSVMNSDATEDNEFIIKWGQPMLLLETETINHSVNTTLTIQAFIQPISIKFSNASALEIKYIEGYDTGYGEGYDIGYDTGYNRGSSDITGMTWFKASMQVAQTFFNLELIPGISLGIIFGGILLLYVVLFLIKWFR